MVRRVLESDLSSIDLRDYEQILISGPSEFGTGIEVWASKKLPNFYDRNTPSEINPWRQLIVEVSDPEDFGTRDRVTAKCMELRQAAVGKG